MGAFLMTKYSKEIIKCMHTLAKRKNVIFLGQSVEYPGNLIYKTLKKIKKNKKLELPVFEDTQMGIATGLALEGFLPICTYPRFDFLLLAMNQLINHLDKFPIISKNQFKPKVIIRVLVGAKSPLDAGEQHTQNYVKQIRSMTKTINVYDVKSYKDVNRSYKSSLNSKNSSLIVEYSELF